MAAKGNRGTYDLGAYRNQRNAATTANRQVVRGTAVPKTHPNPAPQTRKVRRPKVVRKSQKQLRAEARRSRAVAIRAVALAAAEGACSVAAYDALSGLLSLRELEQRIDAGWETLPDSR